MGKPMNNCATQAKEKARQQKQIDKASKRMFTRQKKTLAKTSAPNADSNPVEPIFTGRIVESGDGLVCGSK